MTEKPTPFAPEIAYYEEIEERLLAEHPGRWAP